MSTNIAFYDRVASPQDQHHWRGVHATIRTPNYKVSIHIYPHGQDWPSVRYMFVFSGLVFQHIIGISICMDCGPLLVILLLLYIIYFVYLYLYHYTFCIKRYLLPRYFWSGTHCNIKTKRTRSSKVLHHKKNKGFHDQI